MTEGGYFRKRVEILRDPDSSRESRFFALLEMSCFTASAASLVVLLPLSYFLPDAVPGWVVTVLLSGAVGFLTNYLAIEMLFKPYRPNRFHPLTLLSCGYWKLGLVPRNQNEIGHALGREIEEKLLDPDRLASELCSLAGEFLMSPEFFTGLRLRISEALQQHGDDFAAILHPGMSGAVTAAATGVVTTGNLVEFYRGELLPLLLSPDTRAAAVSTIVTALRKRSPELADTLRTELRAGACDYLSRRLPGGIGAETIAAGLVSRIDRNELCSIISERLGDADTVALIDRGIIDITKQIGVRLSAPESAARLDKFTSSTRERLEKFLSEQLRLHLPEILRKFAGSDMMWERLRSEALPAAAPELEKLLDTHARLAIVKRLNISGRISDAVAVQDVEEFHRMIDRISARHLAAIQVLGYILGALIGAIQALLTALCR